MRFSLWVLSSIAFSTYVYGTSLDDVCTTDYIASHLPAANFHPSITINNASVTANPVYNTTVSDETFFPDATFDYCNVTFTYSHPGLDDTVVLTYWLPSPDDFQNRYLTTGGGGYAINSGTSSLPGGIIYGAVAGATDGGFGIFQDNAIDTFLVTNGTMDWHSIYMFGYQAIHELTVVGKAFTKTFFAMNETTKLYSYYQACSEGGREGWSQVQRYGDQFDGAAIGAPALRYAFQQIQHLYSNVVEQTLDYYPPPCELELIVNATITACDPFDGRVDGVVSRSDLCALNYDIDVLIGESYYCAATEASPESTATPAQNGTVSAEGVAVAKTILDGLHDSDGKQVYFSYQPAASFDDAETAYNATTGEWELSITDLGATFPEVLLMLQNGTTLPTLDGVTYDTIRDWIAEAWSRYSDSLMTNNPDLSSFKKAGGKVIHFHGESDASIPTASSVRYYESVRKIMNPGLSYNDSVAALNDWYRLYLVPGAAHCATNPAEPNGPFPQTNLAVLIDWVENGVEPVTLNATVLQGEYIGEEQQICSWPLRPLWTSNGTVMECIYDQTSIDIWEYDLNSFLLPVY